MYIGWLDISTNNTRTEKLIEQESQFLFLMYFSMKMFKLGLSDEENGSMTAQQRVTTRGQKKANYNSEINVQPRCFQFIGFYR